MHGVAIAEENEEFVRKAQEDISRIRAGAPKPEYPRESSGYWYKQKISMVAFASFTMISLPINIYLSLTFFPWAIVATGIAFYTYLKIKNESASIPAVYIFLFSFYGSMPFMFATALSSLLNSPIVIIPSALFAAIFAYLVLDHSGYIK